MTHAFVPTLLAPYLATETPALRYESSLTLLNLHGSTATGEAYSLTVSRNGGTIRVSWSVSTLEPSRSYRTARRAYWRKPWGASFRSEKKAIVFAASKLETLRGWAAARPAA